jgi:hypothetical protein
VVRSRDNLYASLLAAGALALYSSLLSKGYVFEGLIRAMPIDASSRWGYTFPGNYLLYGPLGLLFHGFLTLLGIHQPAVVSLQIMDASLGAAGVFIFFLLLRRLGGDLFSSAIWTAILGSALAYMLWSTEAEDYMFSTVLLLLNFAILARGARERRYDPVLLGGMHALAILGHIVNVLFGAVVLYFLWVAYGKKWLRPAAEYLVSAACVVASVYGAVIVFVLKPSSFRETIIWLEGSAGAGGGALNTGGGYSLAKLLQWLKMSLHIFISFQPGYVNPPPLAGARYFLIGAGVVLTAFAVLLASRLPQVVRKNPAVVGGCAIWLAAYAVLFSNWQPYTMVYRVSDLIPLCVLLFLGYESVAPRLRSLFRGLAAALAVCLAVGNLGAELLPRSIASNNPALARMAFLKANTREGDWIAGDGGQDEIYIPYFALRRPILIAAYRAKPEKLAALIDGLLTHGQDVFVTSRILEADLWKAFFGRYHLTLQARDPAGGDLYKVGVRKR